MKNLQRLRESISRYEWHDVDYMTADAFYNSDFNDISKILVPKRRTSSVSFLSAIPVGILRPPFFHKDAPK